jgi:thiamine-phosphate pyrophosphorylase
VNVRPGLRGRLALMVITDPGARIGMVAAAEAATAAGAPALQLRWKGATTRQLLDAARELRSVTRGSGALLIVNDRVDIAMAVGADGAHLGHDDLPLAAARRIVPRNFLLGKSVDTPDQAADAEAAGADYLGLGPIFATTSKLDTGAVVGEEGIAAVRSRIGIPFVGIGGIDAGNAALVVAAGADGAAVLGAVMAAADPAAATRSLLEAVRRG